jgi:hypothetical protein
MGDRISFLARFWHFILWLLGRRKKTQDPGQTAAASTCSAHIDEAAEAVGPVPEPPTDFFRRNEDCLEPPAQGESGHYYLR